MAHFLSATLDGRDNNVKYDEAAFRNFGPVRTYRSGLTTLDAGQNDTIEFLRLPFHTILIPDLSTLHHGAAGAGVTLDIGWLANAHLGITADVDGLADGLDIAAAGSKKPFGIIDKVASVDKPLWAIVGLTADPGEAYTLPIVGTFLGANPINLSISLIAGIQAR